MNRKGFIKNCAKIAGAGMILPVLGTACKTFAYVPHSVSNEKIVVKKSDFGAHPFVLVKVVSQPAPVYVGRLENGKYNALLLQCTHRACEVRPVGKEFHCPCHGSVFNNSGAVLESPAERPLKQFEVSEDAEKIYLKT